MTASAITTLACVGFLAIALLILWFSEWARVRLAHRILNTRTDTLIAAFAIPSAVAAHWVTVYAVIAWMLSVLVFLAVLAAGEWADRSRTDLARAKLELEKKVANLEVSLRGVRGQISLTTEDIHPAHKGEEP
jgi:hypothetical protein